MENENGELETLVEVEETTTPTEEKAEETPKNDSETVDELAELRKKADLAENYKIRAEKAEKEAKKFKESSKKDSSKDEVTLTAKDTLALINAKVSTDNFDTVVDWAKFKKIPISEALKDRTLQAVLRDKEEEKITAEATTTRGVQRGIQKQTPEEIVARASKGLLSDSDEDMDKLVEARMQLKLKKLQK